MDIGVLLDRYGQPPPEVVRDWVWQLHRHRQNQATSPPIATEQNGDSWLSIVVGPDGLLDLRDTSPSAVECGMRQLREWLDTEPRRLQPVAVKPASGDSNPWADRASADVHGAQGPRISRQARRSAAGRQPIPRDLLAGPRTMVVAIGALGVLLVGGWLWQRRKPERLPAAAVAAAAADMAAASEPLQSSLPSAAESESEIEVTTIAPPLSALGLEELVTSAPQPASQPLSIRPDLDWPPTGAANLRDVSDLTTSVAQEASAAAHTGADQQEGYGPGGMADVMREVTRAFEQAETQGRSPAAQPMEDRSAELSSDGLSSVARPDVAQSDVAQSDVAQSDVAQSDSGQPELTQITLWRDRLRTTVQIQGNDGTAQRSRAHVGTLTLQQPTGYRLEPVEPQMVEARQPIYWRLSDENAGAPRACLVVQAVQRSRRGGELELLFYGSAEDLPQLTLPLGRKVLDPLLFRLQAMRSQLERFLAVAAKMKTSAETRAQLAEQKKLANEQLHLCHRLIEIIAQCDHLADLIDGQVTILAN